MKLDIHHVGKRISGVDVLSDVSLSLRSGQVVGLSGANGSGKTMLMRIVLGLVAPTTGAVRIDGRTIGRDCAFPPSVGALIESPAFLDARTGYGNLALLTEIKGVVGRDGLRATLVDVGLDPDDARKFRKYSLGMKQRLGIAAAVMERPDLIVLDEPTNALDASGIAMVRQLIDRERSRGAAILLACHDKSLLRDVSTQIVYLSEGHVDGHEVREGDRWALR